MSACFSFGLTAGEPIAAASVAAGTKPLWSGLPALIVVMFGGFTTNFIWCVILNVRNRSGYEYVATRQRRSVHAKDGSVIENPTDAPAEEMAEQIHADGDGVGSRIPLMANYFFSALAGATWYFQFFFYSMGHVKMGAADPKGFGFSSWTLHMASIIIFSTMWGWILHEWKGASKKAHGLIVAGILTLILSTVIIGYGTYLKGTVGGH